jgi:hypothetical protein
MRREGEVMAKKYDLAVKVGSYEKNGETKNKYRNIGVVLDSGNGPYILLNRDFNPAGVPCDPDRESIIVSLFAPRDSFGGSPREVPNEEVEDVPF